MNYENEKNAMHDKSHGDTIELDNRVMEDENVIFNRLLNAPLESLVNSMRGISQDGDDSYYPKQTCILRYINDKSESNALIIAKGVYEKSPENKFAFLRYTEFSYRQNPYDIYISPNIINSLGLKNGDSLEVEIRSPQQGERYFVAKNVRKINEILCSKRTKYRKRFSDFVPIFPDEKINMEIECDGDRKSNNIRILDIVSPIGKGQRALIVAPPRTGKTVLLQNIANSITANNPEIHLIVLLVDERPEEVTDMKRSIKGTVVSSTFDEPPTAHVHVAEMTIAQAKRLVEDGRDVVILLDSITRLGRAYNHCAPSSGKILTGGLDSNALQRPKRLLGSARDIEGEGSLTIIATALIETGSKMDEVIFEEFKGTGNCEIVLDRLLANKRIFPAIDVDKSGTRKEDLLLDLNDIGRISILRSTLAEMGHPRGSEMLIKKIHETKTNRELLDKIGQ